MHGDLQEDCKREELTLDILIKMSCPTGEYRIHSLNSRSDLLRTLERHQDTLKQPWPAFFHGSPTLTTYLPRLIDYTGLLRYQYVMVWQNHTGQETLVAHARSVPFYWPELAGFHRRQPPHLNPTISLAGEDGQRVLNSLPDGGYETILSRAVEQFFVRHGLPAMSPPLTHDQARDMAVRRLSEAPNALVSMGIVVHPDWRGQGIVSRMVQYMTSVAGKDGFGVLVTPLRPAGKALFPTVDMQEYLGWRKELGPKTVGGSLAFSGPVSNRSMSVSALVGDGDVVCVPFDPALRKHVSLGGRVVKIARNSISVMRDIGAWEGWTKLDLEELVESEVENCEMGLKEGQAYLEICVPGALVPVRYYPKDRRLVYCEPNVWVYHSVTAPR
ncbi:GNAT family N-acetyltransferase [Aspergillus melleus]|uniref:GNAT family N-acetyltransferase n=1 Tax=Aspergillus melleus TaxID=138277 RepID=UPI001E8CBB81|nr:uncharacterized protein LDX57_010518 [Aspergillus melleus]KAH8432885.1 hypothetical protein LDX57_010518 [Aspergillus melleus]